jgi:hypothetical protein
VVAPAGQHKIRVENGVTIITNGKKPDPPKGAPTKLVLEELYSVGGGDKPEESFADISALDVLKDGTVYVLDTKDSRVKVFDAKGKFVRAFGKAGQGPGEFNQPVGILITPENEVLVEDALNQRLAFFSLAGTFIRQVSTVKALGLSGIQMDGRGLVVARSMGIGEAGKLSMDVKTYDRVQSEGQTGVRRVPDFSPGQDQSFLGNEIAVCARRTRTSLFRQQPGL